MTRQEFDEAYDNGYQHGYAAGRSDSDILDKIREEIAEYGSIWVAYAITDETKTDKGIRKLVSDVLKQVQEQVLNVIDKYRKEQADADSC